MLVVHVQSVAMQEAALCQREEDYVASSQGHFQKGKAYLHGL